MKWLSSVIILTMCILCYWSSNTAAKFVSFHDYFATDENSEYPEIDEANVFHLKCLTGWIHIAGKCRLAIPQTSTRKNCSLIFNITMGMYDVSQSGNSSDNVLVSK